jgi:hypothetical protein
MHHMFKLVLGNNQIKKTLFFKIFNTDIAQLWANEIKKGYLLYEDDRFTQWPGSYKNEKYYQDSLKNHIDIINNYDKIINLETYNQQNFLNILHKHFEDLRGHVVYGTDWYDTAPINVQQSVDKLNVLIHEYENYLTEKNNPHLNPTIVCTFKDRPTYELKKEHYKHFTHKWEFGTVYINYCEVGKPLLDVFKDNDDIVGKDAIRPQSTYSADFMVKFGIDVPEQFVVEKENKFRKWANAKNINIDPSRAALGMIPVAKISDWVDINELKNLNKVIKCIV